MTSYTVQIVLLNPTHESGSAMYCLGDVVATYELITEKPNAKGRLGFIHIHNVPDGIDLTKLEELTRPEVLSLTLNPELSKKRAWMFITNDYPEILTKKHIDIDWSVAANLFTRKFDSKTLSQYCNELKL